ncbi:fumarylacetoacetate hydrolase family protein [Novosphingobium sp.]|uniref:fumarylacetoacetate hydrolase family protein n=1 Tax=Novosphingobium sp. TaxID=1874826 RepID=UPI002633F25F|nr:fumarylacetoacetate hydrolase family protein [Novosphingobium sp.]
MKLVRFTHEDSTRIGKVVGDGVIDLSAITGPGASMKAMLDRWEDLRPALEAAREIAIPLVNVTLEAPIVDPRKFLAIGMNYEKHAQEAEAAGIKRPTSQLWFNKQVQCINGPYAPIDLPMISDKLDYEAELAVVIGKRCRRVAREDARSMIAGYMVCNDVSVRDWQQRSPTFTLGKSFDTHGPIGPWITTDDEVADPHALEMWLTVNGNEKQRTSTGDMIYDIYDQIAYLSEAMTLEPGDILATGTPSGVGIVTGDFMKVGDVVRVEVQGLGHIENEIVAEQA